MKVAAFERAYYLAVILMKVKITSPRAPYNASDTAVGTPKFSILGSGSGGNWYGALQRFFDFTPKDNEHTKWYYNSWIDFGEETITIKVADVKSAAIRYEEIDEIRIQIYRFGEYSKSRYDYTAGSYILIKYKGQKFKYFLSLSEEWADKLIILLKQKDVHLIS